MKHWYYSEELLKETYAEECPDGYIKGRLPYKYWTQERKVSYKAKHNKKTLTPEQLKKESERARRLQLMRVGYNDGVRNYWFMQGEEIPDNMVRGFINTKHKRKGE